MICVAQPVNVDKTRTRLQQAAVYNINNSTCIAHSHPANSPHTVTVVLVVVVTAQRQTVKPLRDVLVSTCSPTEAGSLYFIHKFVPWLLGCVCSYIESGFLAFCFIHKFCFLHYDSCLL